MTYFAGFVKGIALMLGIPIRWGGDWNGNNDLKDNNFDDLPHFELRNFILMASLHNELDLLTKWTIYMVGCVHIATLSSIWMVK